MARQALLCHRNYIIAMDLRGENLEQQNIIAQENKKAVIV